MQVNILVSLDIVPVNASGTPLAADETTVQAAALQAIRNELAMGEKNGFEHDLATTTCINIQSVQIFNPDFVGDFKTASDPAPAGPKLPTIDDLLDAIAHVESGNDASKVGDNGKSYGAYQIQKPYFMDALPFAKNIMANLTDFPAAVLENRHAREIIKGYWRRYAKAAIATFEGTPASGGWESTPKGISNACQSLARIHNGGPSGQAKAATIPYWEKIQVAFTERGFTV